MVKLGRCMTGTFFPPALEMSEVQGSTFVRHAEVCNEKGATCQFEECASQVQFSTYQINSVSGQTLRKATLGPATWGILLCGQLGAFVA